MTLRTNAISQNRLVVSSAGVIGPDDEKDCDGCDRKTRPSRDTSGHWNPHKK